MKKKVTNPDYSIWGRIDTGKKVYTIKLPMGRLLIKRERELLLIKEVNNSDAEDNLDYEHFVIGEESSVELRPALPALPVVIRPDVKYSVLPKRNLSVWISVPLTIQITAVSNGYAEIIAEIPTRHLSKTWFGDVFEGELALDLSSNFRETANQTNEEALTGTCPIKITNESSQTLEIQRMCLRVPHLTLYTGRKNLYTNESQLRFRGEEQKSQITFQQIEPDIGEPLHIASLPRITPDKNLIRQSFSFIKNLYTL